MSKSYSFQSPKNSLAFGLVELLVQVTQDVTFPPSNCCVQALASISKIPHPQPVCLKFWLPKAQGHWPQFWWPCVPGRVCINNHIKMKQRLAVGSSQEDRKLIGENFGESLETMFWHWHWQSAFDLWLCMQDATRCCIGRELALNLQKLHGLTLGPQNWSFNELQVAWLQPSLFGAGRWWRRLFLKLTLTERWPVSHHDVFTMFDALGFGAIQQIWHSPCVTAKLLKSSAQGVLPGLVQLLLSDSARRGTCKLTWYLSVWCWRCHPLSGAEAWPPARSHGGQTCHCPIGSNVTDTGDLAPSVGSSSLMASPSLSDR